MIKHIVTFFAWCVVSWVSGFYVSMNYEKNFEVPIFPLIVCIISILMVLRSFILGTRLLSYKPKELKR